MTFMRKFLDILNMDNWNQDNNPKDKDETIVHVPINLSNSRTTSNGYDIENNNVKTHLQPSQNKNDLHSQPQNKLASCVIAEPENTFESSHAEECTAPEEYKSSRTIIKGLHLYFIDVAREIVSCQRVNIIPLMREFRLQESDLNNIISEITQAQIIDTDYNVLMTSEELERFIDIYEPSLFYCKNTVFDKEILLCIGEIIFDNGVDKTYDSLPADEILDYLNILEKLKVIKYNPESNNYELLVTHDTFDKICSCIPDSFSSSEFKTDNKKLLDVDYDNLSGIEFEKYAAHVLSLNGFENIKFTPASGDHGIDILAVKNDISYAIQCKCYSSNIGNSAIQQAHTGKSIYHKDVAVVLTNQYFTPQAISEANTLNVKLWDRNKLNSLIKREGK